MPVLEKAPPPEIAGIFPGGLLDEIGGELEQADFPAFIHPDDDGAQRILRAIHFDLQFGDHRFERAMDGPFADVGFAKAEAVFENGHVRGVLAHPVDERFRAFAETFHQRVSQIIRRENLGTLGVQPAFANAHLLSGVHEFGHEVKMESGVTQRGDAALGGAHDFGVLDGELESVLVQVRGDYDGPKAAQGSFCATPAGTAVAIRREELMPKCRHRFARIPRVMRGRNGGGALLETIVAMAVVAIFLSGLHLTNSQVMSQVRASLESSAALRVLTGRTERVRAATWSQLTDPAFLQTTLLAESPDCGEDLGNLVENLAIDAHTTPPGTVQPILLTRAGNGAVTIINPGDGTMPNQPSVRVDLTALWTGKGGRARTRQVALVIAQGGLTGRN